MRFVALFISRKKIESIHFLQDNQKIQFVLALKSWIFICFVGRFPAILLTALSGAALGAARYGIVAAIIVVFIICYFLGLRLYKHWNREGKHL